jgi:peroxiredoxin
MRGKILVAVAAGLFALPWYCCPALADVAIGQPAPVLTGAQLDGKSFDLAAQKGKVVIINFWASWCAPCREEMPAFDSIYRRYRKQGLEVVGISMDKARHRDEVTGIMHAFAYPAAMLDDMKTNDFGWPDKLPTTYIVDKNGVLSTQIPTDETPVKEEMLEKIVGPLLAK